MTANERKLLTFFLGICATIVFIFLYMNALLRYSESGASLAGYLANIEKIPTQQPDIKALQKLQTLQADKKTESQEHTQTNAEELLGTIRARLTTVGIIPLRYQISAQGENSTIEFSLQTEPYRFFSFLDGLSKDNVANPITYLAVKPFGETGLIEIILRMKYESL